CFGAAKPPQNTLKRTYPVLTFNNLYFILPGVKETKQEGYIFVLAQSFADQGRVWESNERCSMDSQARPYAPAGL
ncbi:MAG TPA: hypothetical protein VGJ97_13515, partial [Anaerolineaceae bacterium]